MRVQRKQKPSKFFEYFLSNNRGGTLAVTAKEIQDKLRQFYLDLAFGNLQQPKYIELLMLDQERIINESLIDLWQKINETLIYKDAVLLASRINTPEASMIVSNPLYNDVMFNSQNRFAAYNVLYKGLANYQASGEIDPNSIQGNPMIIHPETIYTASVDDVTINGLGVQVPCKRKALIYPERCNPQYLVEISIDLNQNNFLRGAKQQLLL